MSRLNTDIATAYLEVNRAADAAATARKAVNFEHHNADAWETLLAATTAAGADAKTIEEVLREAALALQNYPDLNAQFRQRIANSLRARGETSAADFEERQIARKYQDGRTDLTIAQAVTIMQRAMAGQTVAEQMRVFGQLVNQYGHDAGTDFFDKVARPLVNRLYAQGHKTEAREALNETRSIIDPKTDSQLDQEMEKLAATLK
jgi:hypothetical protein